MAASMNEEMVADMVEKGTLKTERIINAFRDVDRKEFVPAEHRSKAYSDEPLPIGHGQTISQPSTVAFMLELLQPLPGERILDVGCGSGWTTALLSHITKDQGEVFGVERVPELVSFGRNNLESNEFGDARIMQAGDGIGLQEQAPFNRILVSAAAKELPEDLMDQLINGGTIVIPIRGSVYRYTKLAEGNYETEEYPGFRFVPLR